MYSRDSEKIKSLVEKSEKRGTFMNNKMKRNRSLEEGAK